MTSRGSEHPTFRTVLYSALRHLVFSIFLLILTIKLACFWCYPVQKNSLNFFAIETFIWKCLVQEKSSKDAKLKSSFWIFRMFPLILQFWNLVLIFFSARAQTSKKKGVAEKKPNWHYFWPHLINFGYNLTINFSLSTIQRRSSLLANTKQEELRFSGNRSGIKKEWHDLLFVPVSLGKITLREIEGTEAFPSFVFFIICKYFSTNCLIRSDSCCSYWPVHSFNTYIWI